MSIWNYFLLFTFIWIIISIIFICGNGFLQNDKLQVLYIDWNVLLAGFWSIKFGLNCINEF